MRIHKFKIETMTTEIETAPIYKFLHVALQDGIPCVWAEVNDSGDTIKGDHIPVYEFAVVLTGQDIAGGWTHIGSYVASDEEKQRDPLRNCVGHIYYRRTS